MVAILIYTPFLSYQGVLPYYIIYFHKFQEKYPPLPKQGGYFYKENVYQKAGTITITGGRQLLVGGFMQCGVDDYSEHEEKEEKKSRSLKPIKFQITDKNKRGIKL